MICSARSAFATCLCLFGVMRTKEEEKKIFLYSVVESDLQATNDERRSSLTQE